MGTIIRLLILLLSFKKPSIASAQLVQGQEQGFWPDFNGGDLIWDGMTFLRGVGDALQNPQYSDYWQTSPPQPTDQNSPNSLEVAPASQPSSDTLSPAEPVYKIEINNDPSPLPDLGLDLPAVQPSVTDECDPMNISDPDCTETTDQLVFTSSCEGIDPNQVASVEAKAQNQAIRESLVLVNNQNTLAGRAGLGLRISTSQICDVFLFAIPLTKNQIQDIEKKPGVKSVRPNQALQTENVPASSDLEDSDSAEIPVLTAPGSQLKERDRIVVDSRAWNDLRFISTPVQVELSNAYSYYSKAGQEVTVFAVDSGVNTLHDEFVTATGESALHQDRIYALDTIGYREDYDDFGTCRASKIVGRTLGVAKRAKVMITMVGLSLGSLLDAMVQIASYLSDKDRRRENVRGYHVMTMMLQWDNSDEEVTNQFETLLEMLVKFYQVVVVVPAGADASARNSDINMWPATAAARHDIIVVGAVQIHTRKALPWSRGGPFLTVSAPGMVRCALNQAGNNQMRGRGTHVAAAQVAGLVAYFLSLDETGPDLRNNPGAITLLVKGYISMVASYRKSNDDVLAIWNLLG